MCFGGTTGTGGAAVCSEELLSRGKPAKGEPAPMCFEICLSPLHARGKSPIQAGIYQEDGVPGSGQRITGCRNNFLGSPCQYFIFSFGECWVYADPRAQGRKQPLGTGLLK